VERLNADDLAREYRDRGQLLFVPDALSPDLVAQMVDEFRSFPRREIRRAWVPFYRKAGTVGQSGILRRAPLLAALHRSPALMELASRLSGEVLDGKGEHDAHAAALYVYQRPGDHVSFHYDDCGCEDTASYTMTFGLINRTRSEVHFQLNREDPHQPLRERYISMTPGSLVFFCGSRAYHRVTPLGKDEERVTYSFAYVKRGKRLGGYKRLIENSKDALFYFGPRALIQRNY
jgi:hypothetical protein